MARGGRAAGAAPHEKSKAAARVLSPDEAWAAKIRERILADCHPWQRMAVEDPSRRVSMLVGRGGAKTTTMRARQAIKVTSIRRADILYLATTQDHALKLNWGPLQEMNEHYGLELTFKLSDMTATCKRTGGAITMSGMETDRDLEVHRGFSRNEADIDEAASHEKDRLRKALREIIGPRLGDRDGCILIGGTPGHDLDGEFYDATRPGSARHSPYADREAPGYVRRYWSSHAWSLAQVCALPRAAELYPALVKLWADDLFEKDEQGWSDDHPIWMREYLGLWSADFTGRVFQYDPRHHQWDPFGDGQKLEGVPGLRVALAKLAAMGVENLHFVIAADGGHSDPFALNVFAFSPTDVLRRIWHVMFVERTGWFAQLVAGLIAGPESAARAMIGAPMEPLGGVLGEIGWPDAAVMDTDPATLTELQRVYCLSLKKADREANAKKGSIELVNGELHEKRLFVIKGSPLEDQLTQLKWREDINGRLKEDPRQANHSTDTLVYGRKEIAILFESGVVTPEKPGAAAGPGAPTIGPSSHIPAGDPVPGDREYDGLLAPVEFVDAWGNR